MSGSGSYPRTYGAIKDLARKEALQTKTARAIARKAGLSLAPAAGAPAARGDVFTLLDATVGPSLASLRWQWQVDLTHVRALRMDVRGSLFLYCHYSLLGARGASEEGAYDPGDWAFLSGENDDGDTLVLSSVDEKGYPPEAPRWLYPEEAARAPVRLCVSVGWEDPAVTEENPDALEGVVGVMVQAQF